MLLLEREERFTRVSPCLCITEKRKKKESRNIKKEKERNNWNNKQCIVYSRSIGERVYQSLRYLFVLIDNRVESKKGDPVFAFHFVLAPEGTLKSDEPLE